MSSGDSHAPGYVARRRPSLLLPILVAHIALLAWVASERAGAPSAPPGSRLMTFDVASPTPPPSPRSEPVKAHRPLPDAIIAAPTPEAQRAAPLPIALTAPMPEAIPDGGCDLTDIVQSALRGSEAARSAVAALPASARSVANAVMLWDGHWVDAPSPDDRRALMQIRDVVRATVRAASSDCRTQVQAGPRLIVLPGPPDVVLALGSGRWRWEDLDPDEGANTQTAARSEESTGSDRSVILLP